MGADLSTDRKRSGICAAFLPRPSTAPASYPADLNTHTPASLYEAFAPGGGEANRRQAGKSPHPQARSWLDVAEIDLSALSRQCLDRRIPDRDVLAKKVPH